MRFNSNIFQNLNKKKKNKSVRSFLNTFYSKSDSSALSIKLPVTGIEHYTICNKNYTITPDSFLIVDEGDTIECTVDSEKMVESICIYLDKSVYSDILTSVKSEHNVLDIDREYDFDIYSDSYHINGDALSKSLASIKCNNDLGLLSEEDYIILTEKLAVHQNSQKAILFNIDVLNYSTRLELYKRLRKAKAYIYDSYFEDLTLEKISQVSFLSKYHLLRTFKQAFGITPHQALLHRRIEKSKERLLQNLSINAVALECGFNNRRSFSRVFKDITGMTPIEYRKSSLC